MPKKASTSEKKKRAPKVAQINVTVGITKKITKATKSETKSKAKGVSKPVVNKTSKSTAKHNEKVGEDTLWNFFCIRLVKNPLRFRNRRKRQVN